MKTKTPSNLTAAQFDDLADLGLPILRSCSIPSDAVEIVESRVKRLANRADKKGFPKPVLALGPTEARTRTLPDGSSQTVEYTRIAILATGRMAVSGWHLLAVIAPVEKDGKVVGVPTTVPGESARLDLVEDWNRCDHCNARRQRNETFIVENESGEQKQIGRQCLKDFLGHDPSALIGWLDATESLASDEDIESWGSSAPRLYKPTEIIALASCVVANTGFYVSRAKAEAEGLTATGEAIWDALAPTPQSAKDFANDYPATERAIALAEATERANALLLEADPAKVDNDWMWNVRNTVGLDWVQRRHVGIIASSVILGQRLLEREAKEKIAVEARQAKAAAGGHAPSHIGAIGQRLTLDLTVEFSKTFDGQYGTTTLIKLRTAEGDLVQWWASGEWDVETGQTMRLTGTVKAHEEDRFSKEPVTVLTRCKAA